MKDQKTLRLVQLALLLALMAVLSFTPLGFIMIPPVAITIMHIPVIIGAILLGPTCGGILGLAFGVFSMIKAATAATSPVDMLFSPFSSPMPIYSIIMCIGPRVILGILPAFIYRWMKKVCKLGSLCIGISAGISTIVHTTLVIGCLFLLFNAFPLKEAFAAVVSLNGLLELGMAVILSIAICNPIIQYIKTS